MRSIFISYASENESYIRSLSELLRYSGVLAPWFDSYLMAGLPWKWQLENAITGCDIFLYAITQDSVDSDWCQWELELAVRLGKPVVPVMMEHQVMMPSAFSTIVDDTQWVDFRDGLTPKALVKLISCLLSVPLTKIDYPVRLPYVEPTGQPPQATSPLPELTDSASHLEVFQPTSIVSFYTDDWGQQRDHLAEEIATQLMEILKADVQLRFDKFVIQVEQTGHWSEWLYTGWVEATPYDEFTDGPFQANTLPEFLSEEDVRRLMNDLHLAPYHEVGQPLNKPMKQKLLERGWDAQFMTKSWPVTSNRFILKEIGYELIDTQRDVFHVCLGEIERWPHIRGRRPRPGK